METASLRAFIMGKVIDMGCCSLPEADHAQVPTKLASSPTLDKHAYSKVHPRKPHTTLHLGSPIQLQVRLGGGEALFTAASVTAFD